MGRGELGDEGVQEAFAGQGDFGTGGQGLRNGVELVGCHLGGEWVLCDVQDRS